MTDKDIEDRLPARMWVDKRALYHPAPPSYCKESDGIWYDRAPSASVGVATPDLSSRVAAAFPESWLDNLLTGPSAVLGKGPWGCLDIERLLAAVKELVIIAVSNSEIDKLVDEVQRRMDAVVDAAVDWRQADTDEDYDAKCETICVTVDSLLELRSGGTHVCSFCHKAFDYDLRHCTTCVIRYCETGDNDEKMCVIAHENMHEDKSVSETGDEK